MKKYLLTTKFGGYQAKKDVTKTPPNFLIAGSQNVLIKDGEKFGVRKGSSLDGQSGASTEGKPVKSSYDWTTSSGQERNFRSGNGQLQYRYIDSLGAVTWLPIMSSLATNREKFRYAQWWDNAEKKDRLIMCNGASSLYSWSGAVTTVASVTATTITKTGSTSWAEDRFLQTNTYGTRQIVINGVTFNYTGGEGTTTLTGVTPDPTANGIVANMIIHQAVQTHTGPGSGFACDIVEVLKQQLYVASQSSRDVYVSKNTNFTDFAFTVAGRLPGEGMLLTLDGTVNAMRVQEESMYISAGKDLWFQTYFQLSADNTKEVLDVKRLKTGSYQAARSQELTRHNKNAITFVSQEPTLDFLGRVENFNTPQSSPISDAIKYNFER